MSSPEDGIPARPREVIREVPELRVASGKRPKLWALLVGISEYKHTQWSLKFAHRDAESLEQYFKGQRQRGFSELEICKLINEDATERAIRKGLRKFLQRPEKEDFVVVFFACHGGPDPNRPNYLYLFPHDTEPDDIASTAIPMDHVKECLGKANLLSDRVVLLVDACHASGVAAGNEQQRAYPRSTTVDAADAMNRFLADMAKSRPGMATLTAAERGESAWESEEWGGGHGVFTYFLLEGLGGAAVRPEDEGIVTLGGLFDYVTAKVREATFPDRPQRPNPIIDAAARRWPIAVFSDLLVEERHQLGRALYTLGQRLDDPRRFDRAIGEHLQALKHAEDLGRRLPAAHYESGRCLLAKGDLPGAFKALTQAVEEELEEKAAGRGSSASLLADARFWSWATALLAADRSPAAQEAASFLTYHGGDRRASLVKAARVTRRRALLVGVSEYRIGGSLRGPANDVELVRAMLQEAGYLSEDILVLKQEAATRDGIFGALRDLPTCPFGDEEVVFYFSGRTERRELGLGEEDMSEVSILPSDFDGTPESAITSAQLHAALASLPAMHLLAIVDTCHGAGLVERVRADPRYTLLSSTERTQLAREREIRGVHYGEFTTALVAALRAPSGFFAPARETLQAIAKTTSAHQTTVLVGDEARPLLPSFVSSRTLVALNLVRRPWLSDCSPERIEQLVASFSPSILEALPEIRIECGRMALDLRAHTLAADLFQKAASTDGGCAVARLGHAAARVHVQDYEAAKRCLAELDAEAEQERLAPAREALEELLRGGAGAALLVGVSRLGPHGEPVARGALEDVEAMGLALEELFPDKIAIDKLVDPTATYEAVLDGFRALVKRSHDAPCLFYFAGPGEMSNGPSLRVFSGPEQRRHVIRLSELVQEGARARNLICIIDAGWAPPVRLPWNPPNSSRCVEYEPRRVIDAVEWVTPASLLSKHARVGSGSRQYRDVEPAPGIDNEFAERRTMRARAVAPFGIGGLTIYNASILTRLSPEGAEPGENVVEATRPSLITPGTHVTHGVMTHALISALPSARAEGAGYCYEHLHRVMAMSLRRLQPVFVGACQREQFMSNVVGEDRFEQGARRAGFDLPIIGVLKLLDRQIERASRMADVRDRREQERSAYLEKGIALLALGERLRSVDELERALQAGGSSDPEVLAYLGRALAEQGEDLDAARLDAAVLYLHNARELWKYGEVPAYLHYYYGKALQARMVKIQREDSERLEETWRKYLDLGAPLGHRQRVQAYLWGLR